ncbi:MAG: GmrSD restriction endonuclease domain-containing protein [Mesorhizobium sp.]
MADQLHIRKVMEELIAGRMRVPNFQRGFVWDPERVAYLMDSIYKGYPFGSILLWRTKHELTHERDLGPFKLPQNDPQYPTDYILDGQQRITSIFGVFQTDIKIDTRPLWSNIYFDLSAPYNAQDSSFSALLDEDVDPKRHFPIKCLFDPVAYRKETDVHGADLIKRIDELQARFKEALIPVQTITTEDKTAVAIVFERVNQRGVELDTVQLLSAWTWSGDFDLNQKFEELAQDLAPFGFKDVGADKDLLLRCCSAILANDPSIEALINLNGKEVRESFETVTTGIKGAIDFLRKNLGISSLSNLPYDNILVPLSVFFAGQPAQQHRMSAFQRNQILRWFWRTCFSRRLNSQPIKTLREDVSAFSRLRSGASQEIVIPQVNLEKDFFEKTIFRLNSVLSRTYIILLAQYMPKSFISGNNIDLRAVLKEYNRNEFHHIYPRSFIRASGMDLFNEESCLANICFLSRADNNTISGAAPSAYRAKMPEDVSEILESNLIPGNVFKDDYGAFLAARSDLLHEVANSRMGQPNRVPVPQE